MHDFDRFKQDMERIGRSEVRWITCPNCGQKIPYGATDCPLCGVAIISDIQDRIEPIVTNMFQYSHERIIENCTVITLDGINGFMWIDPDGVRHNEGMRWPTMRIEQGCTVQILSDEYGRESKGWYKDGTEI